MKIGLIDADLIDNGSRHPNLALMKISGYMKEKGHETELLLDYNNTNEYEKIYLSKVFDFTNIPIDVTDENKYPNIEYGGTGFFSDKAPDLPVEIEHHMPDYHLYDAFVGSEIARGIKPLKFKDYMDYSIGFATRGCFRKCSFCVNKKYDRVTKHSPIKEFFDKDRKAIYLWDDNFLGFPEWETVLDELESTKRYFQFRQGLDMRLMTDKIAKRLSKVKYHGDYIFAFDHLKDKKTIENGMKIWRKYSTKTTKLYVLCAFESQDENDIKSVFERIRIIMRYKCLPYIMRYDSYKNSECEGMYINLARWCNQPNFFKKKSFREFCIANQSTTTSIKECATLRYMNEFERKYPDIANEFFDMKYEDESSFNKL
jgi:hypothetical protein